MAAVIGKILAPIAAQLFKMVFDLITNLINGWLEERKQDEIDRRVRNEVKNPDRARAARDLDRSFD